MLSLLSLLFPGVKSCFGPGVCEKFAVLCQCQGCAAGIPWSDVNLQQLKGSPPKWSSSSSLSEVTSLTLEYATLGAAMGKLSKVPVWSVDIERFKMHKGCSLVACCFLASWALPRSQANRGCQCAHGSMGHKEKAV